MNPDSSLGKPVMEVKLVLPMVLFLLLLASFPFPDLWARSGAPGGGVVYEDDNLLVSLQPQSPLQGQAVVVSIRCWKPSVAPRQLRLLGKTYRTAAVGKREYKAVCAVPLNAPLGVQPLEIVLSDRKTVKTSLAVRKGDYGEEHLRLPAEMANPTSPAHLKQIKNDRRRLRRAYGSSEAVIRFSHPFTRPLSSAIITPFGRRRYLNDIPKSPHGGIDLRGKTGTPVPAAAGGRVAFSGRLYYSGNAVIIDHGLDIFSLYLHLNNIAVTVGDQVKQGQVVGTVGSTGRVTGPHLHWGIKVNGIFVDPLEFIKESRLLLQPAGEE
jgi:murein DD-endopeptidase MepM/ murein hydrolase activator NlpD